MPLISTIGASTVKAFAKPPAPINSFEFQNTKYYYSGSFVNPLTAYDASSNLLDLPLNQYWNIFETNYYTDFILSINPVTSNVIAVSGPGFVWFDVATLTLGVNQFYWAGGAFPTAEDVFIDNTGNYKLYDTATLLPAANLSGVANNLDHPNFTVIAWYTNVDGISSYTEAYSIALSDVNNQNPTTYYSPDVIDSGVKMYLANGTPAVSLSGKITFGEDIWDWYTDNEGILTLTPPQ
jgi:hypothetical protein